MKANTAVYRKLLKTILWIYIILCVIIAGVNYGYAGRAPESVQQVITWVWMIYENWVKTIFIVVCAFLTLKIVGASGRTEMRKRNLIGFILAALVVHILTPILVYNYELYFYAMPLPWTTTALQLLDQNSAFYHTTVTAWGTSGVVVALIFYLCVSGIVFVGTLLWGRRFQCSSVCLFNGFAAEVFDPAIPLIGKKKKLSIRKLRILNVMRWVLLSIALFFTVCWILYLFGFAIFGDMGVLAKIETYKYLVGELLMMMFFWIAFTGRGYCYFCPLGTTLSLVSFAADQKITTDNTKCIKCSKCNAACPMSIDIMGKAVDGAIVRDIKCVGCGHCVDACPTRNLRYSTRFLDKAAKKIGSVTNNG